MGNVTRKETYSTSGIKGKSCHEGKEFESSPRPKAGVFQKFWCFSGHPEGVHRMRRWSGSYPRTPIGPCHCGAGTPNQREKGTWRHTSGIRTVCAFLIARLFRRNGGNGQAVPGRTAVDIHPSGRGWSWHRKCGSSGLHPRTPYCERSLAPLWRCWV